MRFFRWLFNSKQTKHEAALVSANFWIQRDARQRGWTE